MSLQLAEVTSRGQIVIPQRIRKELGIKPGDSVAFQTRSGTAIMTPVTPELLETLEDVFAWGDRIARIRKVRRRQVVPLVREIRRELTEGAARRRK